MKMNKTQMLEFQFWHLVKFWVFDLVEVYSSTFSCSSAGLQVHNSIGAQVCRSVVLQFRGPSIVNYLFQKYHFPCIRNTFWWQFNFDTCLVKGQLLFLVSPCTSTLTDGFFLLSLLFLLCFWHVKGSCIQLMNKIWMESL